MRQVNIKPRWFAAILVVSLVLPFCVVLAINLNRDPFQIFTPDAAGDVVFLGGGGKSRYQHAGVVHHYSPRTVVVGHSLAANFLPTRVETVLGWGKNYSLALSGAPLYEHGRIVEFALEHADIDQVLWVFSPLNLRLGANVSNPKMPFPNYLYDNFRFNDLGFFTTIPANTALYMEQKDAMRARFKARLAATGEAVDPRDYATAWHFLKPNKFNVPGLVEAIIIGTGEAVRRDYDRAVEAAPQPLGQAEIEGLFIEPTADFFGNLRQNLYTPIAENPDTRFTLVAMPPLPLLYWQHLRTSDLDTYTSFLAYVREAVVTLSALNNVSILAFADEKLTTDLRLYKDKMHYHMAVNDYMLDSIAAGRETLSAANVSLYLSEFDRQVSSYRLPLTWSAVEIQGEVLAPGKLGLGQATKIIQSYTNGQR